MYRYTSFIDNFNENRLSDGIIRLERNRKDSTSILINYNIDNGIC